MIPTSPRRPRPHTSRYRAHLRTGSFASVSLLLLLTACSPSADAPGQGDPAAVVAALPDLDARRGVTLPADQRLETIAFGSCNRTDLPQPLWAPINATTPELWIWLGDNIYGDSRDASVLRSKYQTQLVAPGYQELLAQSAVLGTWDDHDFGSNNGGREFTAKAASQTELLDFLGEPADSPRRQREGVYTSWTQGPEGARVKVILLDARYHRDERGSDGAMLGEAQWSWLAEELASSDAQINLIVSGVQVLHLDHSYEGWHEYPSERTRLLDLIGSSGAGGVILLSGDRHISEIARLPAGSVPYPVYEVTSSGMTHSWDDNPGETNRFRVGDLYTELGFGTIAVDWEGETLSLQLRDPENAVAEERVVPFAEIGVTR